MMPPTLPTITPPDMSMFQARLSATASALALLQRELDQRRADVERTHRILAGLLGAVVELRRAHQSAGNLDNTALDEFTSHRLRRRPTDTTREALAFALLDSAGRGLVEWGELAPVQVIDLLARETARQRRLLQPEWGRKRYCVVSLSTPTPAGTLEGLLSAPSGEPALLDRMTLREALRKLLRGPRRLLGQVEARVCWRWACGWTWAAAAEAEGLEPERGEALRRKLRRLAPKAS